MSKFISSGSKIYRCYYLSFSAEDEQPDLEAELMREDYDCAYNRLKDIDPVAANRIHPNNGRKVWWCLALYDINYLHDAISWNLSARHVDFDYLTGIAFLF